MLGPSQKIIPLITFPVQPKEFRVGMAAGPRPLQERAGYIAGGRVDPWKPWLPINLCLVLLMMLK